MTNFLLDTNAVLLLLAGRTHPEWIGSRKPVSNFAQDEYVGMTSLLKRCNQVLTLPNILTEVSNLIGVGKRNTATDALCATFRKYLETTEELYVESEPLSHHPSFRQFGLTDTAILTVVKQGVHVVTADFALFGKLETLGCKVTNLRHFVNLKSAGNPAV